MHRQQSYTPPDETLAKYARLFVKFGIHNQHGKPLKKGSVVQFTVPEVAKPLYFHLQREILKAGYQPFGVFLPNNDEEYNISRDFFEHANTKQVQYFASKYHRGLVDEVDASIFILADTHPNALDAVNPKRVMQQQAAQKPYKDWRFKKFDEGKFSWTLGLYGTDAGAKEAGLSTRQYWKQIIEACYLDYDDPIHEWKRINRTIQDTAKKLTKLKIKSLHISGQDADLTLGIGGNRRWQAAGGCNVPSYEVFTSPNCMLAEGWIRFSEPHYRYGKGIEGIELWFKDGKVVKSKATKNHDLLKQMLRTKGGDRLGEFSLTDARLSRITKNMADILYDENRGGKYGNTHVAIGSSFHECYNGNSRRFSEKKWADLGFNDSAVHSDFVSVTDRTVTATLENSKEQVIYRKGQFTI